MKKNRLSFSSVSIEEKKVDKTEEETTHGTEGKKRLIKNSTYQYSKKNYGRSRGSGRSFKGGGGLVRLKERRN